MPLDDGVGTCHRLSFRYGFDWRAPRPHPARDPFGAEESSCSVRAREVLALLGEGLSNADAGDRIHMSEATVKTYVSRILAKLGCDNRVQAALLARDAEL